MRSYNQFCPIAKAAELFCERWTALIIRELAGDGARFAQIQRGVPLASPSLLSDRLKQLEREGVITREKTPTGNAWLYKLTDAGREFVPIVLALGIWGQRWSRRELAENEIDLGLLLWALEKGARTESFGDTRTVIEFDITDQPDHKRHWWFLNEAGRCELCISAPGHDADIHVSASLPDLIYAWRGDIPLVRAIDAGRIEVTGTARMRKAFSRWYAIASIAEVEPAQAGVA